MRSGVYAHLARLPFASGSLFLEVVLRNETPGGRIPVVRHLAGHWSLVDFLGRTERQAWVKDCGERPRDITMLVTL